MRSLSPFRPRTIVASALALLTMQTALVGCRKPALHTVERTDTVKAVDSAGVREAAAPALVAPPVDLSHDPETIYDVTYSDSTVIVDEATVRRTLRSVSQNGNVLVFDPSSETAKLVPGSILLMQGLAIREVLAIMPFQGHVAVLTGPAAVTDAIRDGHIRWSHTLDFAAMRTSQRVSSSPQYASLEPTELAMFDLLRTVWHASRPTPLTAPLAAPDDDPRVALLDSASGTKGAGISGTIKDWDYALNATPHPGRLDLQMSLKRVFHGVHALLVGEGHVDNFNMASDVQIHSHALTDFVWTIKDMTGVINFSWEVGKEGQGPWTEKFEIPMPPMFSQTLLLGPLPYSITVGEQAYLQPAFSSSNQLSEAHFRIEFNGSQGFDVHSGNMDDHGAVSGKTEILNTHAISPGPGFAFVAAIAAPRIELKIGTTPAWDALAHALPIDEAEAALRAFAQLPWVKKMLATQPGQTLQRAAQRVATALSMFQTVAAMALKSDAAAHLDFILSASLLGSGPLVIVPCTRANAILSVKVGANAELFGIPLGSADKVVYHHGVTEGPNTGPCSPRPDGT